MRDLCEVLDQILAVVPDDEAGLRGDLLSVRSSAEYAAPESMAGLWQFGSSILAQRLGGDVRPEGTWQREVQDIWCGRLAKATGEGSNNA